MNRDYHRLLFVFVDGVGLAPETETNPLAASATLALTSLLGGPLTSERVGEAEDRLLVSLDARLGVDGLPQSATGQTTLLTGVNGAELMERHVTAFPGPRLQALLGEKSLFLEARRAGLRATFANAYTAGYLEALERGARRRSATTVAVQAAGLPFRTVEDLLRGEAVSWDVTRDLFGSRTGESLAPIEARRAGSHLAGIAASHHLTLYETFVTDLAGHSRWGVSPEDALSRLDGLLAGLLESLDPGITLLLTSDHGNLEDATTRGHTLNPVPLLVCGPLAPAFRGLESLVEVTPTVLASLRGDRR